MLVILTDGDDNASEHSISDAKRLLGAFNEPNDNVTFVIGLGSDVNRRRMDDLCSTGSMYIPARDSSALHTIFALLSLRLTHGIEINMAQIATANAQAVLAQVQRRVSVQRGPVDLLLLVDISGSMRDR